MLVKRSGELIYEYDFSDSWIHSIKVEKRLSSSEPVAVPRCTAGEGSCPPEGCGGIGGYGYLLVMYGASTSPHQLVTTAQVLEESLSGAAFCQLIRPGTPALFANAPMGVSMKSGAPTTGVPEVSQLIYLTGQMARHYNLPWRVVGPFPGSKIVDFCAGAEAALRAHAAILGGANWISHCCGSLEGGMQLNLAKMVHDAELMDACYLFARGFDESDLEVVVQMMRDLGSEGHFLGADYTLEHLAFIPELQDNETHDTWVAGGSKDAHARGLEAARRLLERYDEMDPGLDPAIDEALLAYVKMRAR